MIRVDIETIIMASGPVPSVIVLRERGNGESANAPSRSLSIQTGSVEAAAISRGIDNSQNNGRPITHDLFIGTAPGKTTSLTGELRRIASQGKQFQKTADMVCPTDFFLYSSQCNPYFCSRIL